MLAPFVGAVLLLLSGCAAAAPPPVKLTVSVFQYRSDYAVRQAQIEIVNHSTHDLRITSASFRSDWFSRAVSSHSTPSDLDAGSTVDFPVVLPPGVCSAADVRATVSLSYRLPDGTRRSATVTPTIPFESIATVHAQDCAQREFEKVAAIGLPAAVRYQDVDGKPVALIDVTITPTGTPGAVVLHSTEDTTLLAQREGTLRSIEQRFDAGTPPMTITLDYVPAGCLQHRVAEDKVGTLIPFHVDAGPYRDAEFSIPLAPAVKDELLDWVGRYCGW